MRIYDFRSDTITRPSQAMRDVMYKAECGDDVYLEDNTVIELERLSAEFTGKEKGLFVSSGTMGNLLPLMIFGGIRKEIIVEKKCHILHYELGGVSSLASLMPVAIETEKGILTKELVSKVMNDNPPYFLGKTSMVSVENTHNKAGGTCYPLDTLKELYDYVNSKKVYFHMDGARVFNAAVAQGTTVKEISKYTDSITFCLSKGLGAPMGAMLCGDADFIEESRVFRKIIGGGLRQIGIMASAGIYALTNNIPDLEIDHKNAKLLANAVNESGMGKIDLKDVETNILVFDTFDKAEHVCKVLENNGIKTIVFDEYKLRMVTHRDISEIQVKEAVEIMLKWKSLS